MDARTCTPVKYQIHSDLGNKIFTELSFFYIAHIENVHFLCLKLQSTLCDMYSAVPNALMYRVFQGKSLHTTQSN